VATGLDIINHLRGHTTGYGIPQFVVDGPGGGGKIPLNPDYILNHQPGRVILRNYQNEVFEYPDPNPIPEEALEALKQQVEANQSDNHVGHHLSATL
jgi:lysine 2,3-aminomutase